MCIRDRSSACAKATILDVDVVEDDDERKPAKCAMESIIRSKRRGFIVCVCACVCVSLCTKNEVKEGQAKKYLGTSRIFTTGRFFYSPGRRTAR